MRQGGKVPLLVLGIAAALAAAGLMVWRHAEVFGLRSDSLSFSDYAGFRLDRGHHPDADLERALLSIAERGLREHDLQARGDGPAAADDEFAVVAEPSTPGSSTAVTVRLVTQHGTELWSGEISAVDPAKLRSVAEEQLAGLLRDPRFGRTATK